MKINTYVFHSQELQTKKLNNEQQATEQAMLIVRSPLRISLAGGGTDLPAYYREHGGVVINTAIDRYFYVFLKTQSSNLLFLDHF